MTDLTKIDQPFGTLDIETKLALHRAYYEGKRIESASPYRPDFERNNYPAWHPDYIYRVAPPPQRDIQVPWHVFGPEVQWAARDSEVDANSGIVWAYNRPPRKTNGGFWTYDGGGMRIRIDNLHLIGFDPGNKPWDQSLVRRPEGV